MKNIFLAGALYLAFQVCMFGASKATSIQPESARISTLKDCPKILCKLIGNCQYGTVQTYFDNGCPACGRCRKLSECPQVNCLDFVCPHGDRATTLPNGCPGCPECIQDPECPMFNCLETTDCQYGTVQTFSKNGCPACDRCRELSECEEVFCLAFVCPNGDTPGKQENGCPGCPVCNENPIYSVA